MSCRCFPFIGRALPLQPRENPDRPAAIIHIEGSALPGSGDASFIIVHILESGRDASESSLPVENLDFASFVQALLRSFCFFACSLARPSIPNIDTDASVAESSLPDARQWGRRFASPGQAGSRAEEAVVGGLLQLPESVAAMVVPSAMLEDVGMHEERGRVLPVRRREGIRRSELAARLEVRPLLLRLEAIVQHRVTAEAMAVEGAPVQGAERGRVMRRHRERKREQVESVTLQQWPIISKCACTDERRGRRTKVSLSPPDGGKALLATRAEASGPHTWLTGKPEPELFVLLHCPRNLEGDQIQAASRALVDEELARLGLPRPIGRAVQITDEAPNRVRGCAEIRCSGHGQQQRRRSATHPRRD